MPQFLELAHLVHDDGMPEVQVGRGGIESDLDAERDIPRQFLAQILLAHEVHDAAADDLHLFIDSHVNAPAGVPALK